MWIIETIANWILKIINKLKGDDTFTNGWNHSKIKNGRN